jgi:proteasome lid subunit RPN8/RPN11
MTAYPKVFLPRQAFAAMRRIAEAAFPQEACGLLLGSRFADGAVCIDAFRPTGNDAEDAHHGYLIPPLELLAADGEARAKEEEIVGIWHSHPGAPAFPSRRDTNEAWQGYSYGIHAVTEAGAGELRFFELSGDTFLEAPFTLVEKAGE